MTLHPSSVEWSIDSVAQHSDGDIFPKIIEFQAIRDERAELVKFLSNTDLDPFSPGPSRRFIVPKDEISYRLATQLDPQDSIILSALLYQYGKGIEDRRLPKNIVYSYRFGPTGEHGLYASQSAWNEFWEKAKEMTRDADVVLYCDIADFYNQISHHTVENQLIESGFPNQAIKWIIGLLESTTAGVSRGVPIGPHAIHLLAEASLIPVDNALTAEGFRFLRFADDILVFCPNQGAAKLALARMAYILDKQQRLMLQQHKTTFMSPADFRELCNRMVEDRPINSDERDLLALVKKYSNGNPYKMISFEEIEPGDWKLIREENISLIIEEYISQEDVDYIRLRWFYRRLSQVGHPGAVRVSLERIDQLGPCFANVCAYLASVQNIEPEDWKEIGKDLLALLDRQDVKESEFFRLSILSLFSRNAYLNHFDSLSSLYSSSDPNARREILLAASRNGVVDWVRGYKESFDAMDVWQKRAYLYCSSQFPADERRFFLRKKIQQRPFEKTLIEWAMKGSSNNQ